MDFSLTKEEQLQQQLYRQFAVNEVKPLAQEMDEAEKFSPELLEKMKKTGLFSIPFPQEYGGAGSSVFSYILCMEEIAKADASAAVAISVHTSLCGSAVLEFANDEQKDRIFRPLAAGEKLGCFALTEPGAGSDVAGLRTTAVKDGEDYVLDGAKVFITNSGFADTFLVFAVTDRSAGVRGMSCFIVERDKTPGMSVGPEIPRMGIRAASNCEVFFDNARVPAANLLGKEGMGFKIAMKTLDGGRIGVAAQALGIAQGAFDETVKYVRERKQFGKPIAAFQNTQFKLAEMQTQIDAARLLVWRAAIAKDRHEPYSGHAAMAKLFASGCANDVTRQCVQLFGGYGYSREYEVERMMRDAKITEIYEGTSEVQKMVIAGGIKLK